ncbi:coiled-coil domain-containing protein 149 isoform X2 [Nilaparvata lugens]|uniref:coiled-coil domain-containing protein 149 isoform X2 n=1 Tax=Nilaparvata lugens TaxID=108931 RepID=UPI00193E1CC6|nr:coiled-coil domain-containing protein 149 isoform X2 [Nilaparvata lugens]
MDQYADNYIAENGVLRRKLQSKAEALLILSQELEQCRTERDQFKLMAEQIQGRYSKLKKICPDSIIGYGSAHLPGKSVAQLVEELSEKNKALILEQDDLKQKLKDAYGDIKVLRAGLLQRARNAAAANNHGGGSSAEAESAPGHQREELVSRLEAAGARCTQLQADVRQLLDDKEEMERECDAYRCKAHRLNHQLAILLRSRADPHGNALRVVDIDALVMENRYLQERLEQLQEEKEMSQQTLSKYKAMLEKKRQKGSLKLGHSGGGGGGLVVSHKQVHQLLSDEGPPAENALVELRSLCLALLEALQDKSLALAHQKKSNRILAGRVRELEQRTEVVFPSQMLLQGYSGAQVDKEQMVIPIPEAQNNGEQSSYTTTASKITKIDNDSKDEKISSPDNSIGDEDALPPRLQQLVLSAMKEIEAEPTSVTVN